MAEVIPLFPLQAVLFPKGRLLLQIFESRYIDLVRRSLRNESCFGIILIRGGEEVIRHKSQPLPDILHVGSSAKIVAWDGLPNHRLSITIEGQQRFRLLSVDSQSDKLMYGEVEWIDTEPCQAMAEKNVHMKSVLQGLLQYDEIKKLEINYDVNDAVQLSHVLAQLLPISNLEKQELLEQNVAERLTTIHQHLQIIGGE